MSQDQQDRPRALHNNVGSERRTIRFAVSAEGSTEGTAEFYSLDKARLHAWTLALEGHLVRICKLVYNTLQLPAVQTTSAVVEEWDERSTFMLLNAEFNRP